MMRVRHLRNQDRESVKALGSILFREADEIPLLQKALIRCVPSLSYVVIEDNIVVGFTLVCRSPTTSVSFDFMNTIPNGYELAFLGISPTHQGKGLGKRLLQETISNLHRISMKFTCWLLVDITNVSAIKLYQKWGFRKWKEITPEIGEPGWIMGLSYRRYRGPTVESCA